jgi:hypothetical protein
MSARNQSELEPSGACSGEVGDAFLPAGVPIVSATMASGSMFPFVPVGSKLYFERPERLSVGDIVVVRFAGGWRCHRLVALRGAQAITWGDWVSTPDPPVPTRCVEARCAFVRRKGQLIPMDLPLMRLANRLVALLLPVCKGLQKSLLGSLPS